MNLILKKSYKIFLILVLVMLQSCSKEEDNQLKAVFSFVSDGFMVNFTNFSVGATEYLWDFGDGGTSKLRSPTHVFKSTGDFEIKLVAKQGDAISEFTDVINIEGPNIKIDGNFTDWEHVPFLEVEGDGEITKMKVYGVGESLNFYIEGTSKFIMPYFQVYIDTDNNPATGFYHWMYPVASGAEYMIEGIYSDQNPELSAGNMRKHTDPNHGWGWESLPPFQSKLRVSPLKKTGDKNVIELSLHKSLFGTLSGQVNFCFVQLDIGWNERGHFPESQLPNSGFGTILLK